METPATDWIDAMPGLRGMDSPAKALLKASATRVMLPQGATVFRPGDAATQFPLVVSGSIRVEKITTTGGMLLYRVTEHETSFSASRGY